MHGAARRVSSTQQHVYAALAVLLAVLWARSSASPYTACDTDGANNFVADDRSLCMFYQCAYGKPQPVACAKGSRVPSYYTKGQSNPCIVKVKKDALAVCDRCNVTDDRIPTPNKTNQCAQFRPCDARPGCTCVDQVSGYYCNCSLSTVAAAAAGPTPTPALTPVQECDINVCQNNGTCYSLYKNKFCNCKPRFTGKRCEYDACRSLSCGAHGYCVANNYSVHCECDRCYTGPCCENLTANCTPCTKCFGGATCNSFQTFLCDCVKCNKNEACHDGLNYYENVTCGKPPDTAGSEFTLMFTDNLGLATRTLEIYVYAATDDQNPRYVRVDVPLMGISIPTKVVQPNKVERFTFNDTFLHQLSGKRKLGIRVIETNGSFVNVYCINKASSSADGWLALPDRVAGQAFLVLTYTPVSNANEFAFVAIENGTIVNIKLADDSVVGRKGAVLEVHLDAWETFQVQSARPPNGTLLDHDFTGTSLVSNKRIHVYSGEARAWVAPSNKNIYKEISNKISEDANNRSRDILVVECTSVDTWGKDYALVPLPRTIIAYEYTEEYIKIVSYARATCTLYTTTDTSPHSELIFDLTVKNRNDVYYNNLTVDAAYNYFLSCDIPVMVVEITESSIPFNNTLNDPSFIYVPAVTSYSNNYHFNPPQYSGGSQSARPYKYTYARLIASASEYMNIRINEVLLSNTTLETLKNWTAIYVPVGRDNLYGCIVRISSELPTSISISKDAKFAAIVEGFDDRESYGIVLGANIKPQNSSFNMATFQSNGNVKPIVF